MNKTTNHPGLDYSAGQPINRNTETGIRYGIIPSRDVNPDALEDIYSNGADIDYEDYVERAKDAFMSAMEDYLSKSALDRAWESVSDELGDNYESTGDCTRYSYEADGYKLQIASDGDVCVLESPYFTYAQFCSPCAPGACYLRNPLETPEEANRCYCLGADWFEGNQAPYPIYNVGGAQ